MRALGAALVLAGLGIGCSSGEAPPPNPPPPPATQAALPPPSVAAAAGPPPAVVPAPTVPPVPTRPASPAPAPASRPVAVAPPPDADPDPAPSAVVAPPVTVAPPPPPAVRAFQPGVTMVENIKAIGRDLDKFDTRGLVVRRAAEVRGRIDFEVLPAKVEPGQHYTVKVFLTNEGSKEIKVEDVGLILFHGSERSTRSVKARTDKLQPTQRVLVTELSETAPSGLWAVEITVFSKRKDVYRNRLVWK